MQSRLLAPLARQQTILLTTHRRNGAPVGTPVHIAVAGDHAFIRTYDKAGKHKRLRRNPRVAIAPSTIRGVPTGAAIEATARELVGPEATIAARALSRKYPVLHGWLIPTFHRLRGYRTVHYRLDPLNAGYIEPADARNAKAQAPALEHAVLSM